jgi:hypothetical protein
MKEFKVIPLNVLESRRLRFLPPHLDPIDVGDMSYYQQQDSILKWIYTNLKSRFFFGYLTKLSDNKIVGYHALAFEDPYEATMFLLGCPHLAKNKVDH